MRLIDADKLHIDKQINGECWISQEQIINALTVEPQEDVKDILDKIMDEVEVKESPFNTVYAKGVQDGIDRCIAIIKKYRNSV